MTRAAVSELWDRIEPILDTALDLAPESWPDFLDAACGGDAVLREAVERLLVSAGSTTTPTNGEIGAVAWAQPILLERELAVPSRIGPYSIDRVLGRGGMGAVYLARRDGAYNAPLVALKVMRNGLDHDRVLLRRFTEERQILATLEHPGVARLLEGGVTGEGHPWFAMEYVDGVPLHRYIEWRTLTVPEKLRLFLQIADAVSYAHRNLVVHRDLKPSNILVTPYGTIKLLDFGIAKLLAPSLTTETITRTGFQPFTPEYASPEQVLGEPVTTRADVYALGVILYELLTGQRPLKLTRSNPAEWTRLVRESVPRAPSTVVPDGISLRGDLDSIVLMALRREPELRYQFVDRMTDDVRRHLERRRVRARASRGAYGVVRFLRRNSSSVGAIVVSALAVATFSIMGRAQRQGVDPRPAQLAAKSDQASPVTHTLWSLLGPLTDSLGHPLSVADVVDYAEPTIARQYANDPGTRASMESALGQIYLSNGDLPRAERLLRKAVASQRELRRDSALLAARLEMLAKTLTQTEQYAAAESAGMEAHGIRTRLPSGLDDQEAAATLGTALLEQEKYAQAENIFRDIVASQEKSPSRAASIPARLLLGEALRRQGRNEEASAVLQDEVEKLQSASATDTASMTAALTSLGASQGMLGHAAFADSLLRRAYTMLVAEGRSGVECVACGAVLANRAELAARTGDDARAQALADSARTFWNGILPNGDAQWSALGRVEALSLRDRRQPDAAIARLRALLDTLRASPHPNLYSYRRTEGTLADIFDRSGAPDSAAAHRALSRPGAPLVHARKS